MLRWEASSGRAVLVAFVLSVGGNLPMFLTGALAVQMRADLGFGDTGLGLALGVPYGTAAVLAAPIGHAAARLGWRSAVRMAGVATGLTLIVIAVLVQSFPALLATLAVAGASLSMTVTSSSLIIAEAAPAHRRGLVFATKQSAIPIATMLAGLAVPALGLTLGWRWGFAAACVIPLLAVSLTPRRTVGQKAAVAGLPVDLRMRSVWDRSRTLLSIAAGLATLAVSAFMGFLVPSAIHAGVAAGTAGVLLAVASIASLVVRMGAGLLVDRIPDQGLSLIGVLLLLGASGLALVGTQEPRLIAVGGVLAYAAGWGWPGLLFFAVAHHWPGRVGEVTGALQVGLMLGLAVGPLAFGALASTVGYGAAWIATAGTSVLAGLGFLIVGQQLHRGADPSRVPR